MATPEATLRQEILKRIREDYPPRRSGVLIFGRPASGSTGPGHPDLFGVAVGHFLALEIKMPKGKPTDLQVQRIKDLRSCGAYAWVIHSTLDATRAVFVAKRGGPVPNTDDPIDFDEWFKSITNTPTDDAPAAEQMAAAPEADLGLPQTSEEMATDWPEERALSGEADLIPDAVAAPEDTSLDNLLGELPDLNEAPASVAANEAMADLDLSMGGEAPKPVELQAEAPKRRRTAAPAVPSVDELNANVLRLEATIKAVGERVTICYEAVNRVETLLRSRHVLLGQIGEDVLRLTGAVNKLLSEVQLDDAQIESTIQEPTPFDDAESLPNGAAEAPAPRGRGRPRNAA